ncbi:bifunctional 3-phenylpropionate/cinnamic acid dioxygenase ferredoxin subunit [Actinoplanes sp. NEAU-A12]|uniref:Bifunctional 3-phenylpropionate/cinnamic acid dioxygenase ferredoxin subunit n=1 Tax=Actinoplanes sandaracinus TaxID=3045177 RepID=A0ABT6WBH0_9ACTN|nr:bifunctional 3-phenylpropionate/cinnamic acid dioxygenase ferredoxin subunit [Actinoplanes sandaracinus]MDI6097050.1 bifunctional 3-phenylpropionate/cinnamic acid dioxygenase ferredoxin subunit [Actinoplanes sandaracinus]
MLRPVCPLSAIPSGEAYRWDTDPPVAIFHTEDGEIFAIDDTCTHQDASLADGWLEGCEVECPLHASRFDLRTGRADAPPAKKPVRTHRVEVTGGVVHVELSEDPADLPPGAKP